jgi:hypothetical protein
VAEKFSIVKYSYLHADKVKLFGAESEEKHYSMPGSFPFEQNKKYRLEIGLLDSLCCNKIHRPL